LNGFDKDLREKFFDELGKHVTLRMETNVSQIQKQDNNSLLVNFKEGGNVSVDCVLVATGRKPNIEGLGLENVNVETRPNDTIIVNDEFQTSEPSIYALGDIIGTVALTPVALAQGMALAQTLFTNIPRSVNYRNIATAIFSHPNMATIGLNEAEAEIEYDDISVFESDFRHLKHTISGRDERTYMKVIVNKADDKVLGMHMMGADAGEIIQGFAVAMNCGLTKAQLDITIGIHPTAAEELVTMRQSRH
jgi:glutathione reductase (NADPH)